MACGLRFTRYRNNHSNSARMSLVSLTLGDEPICTVDLVQQTSPTQKDTMYWWLSWWTNERCRGRGLATMNVRLALESIEWTNDTVVYAMINESNPASRRVAEKAGFIMAPEELQVFKPKSRIYQVTAKDVITMPVNRR